MPAYKKVPRCPQCENKFATHAGNIYCSPECLKAANYGRPRPVVAEATQCRTCGADIPARPLTGQYHWKRPTYCSRSCSLRGNAAAREVPELHLVGDCLACGIGVLKRSWAVATKELFCEPEHANQWRAAREHAKQYRACLGCGLIFFHAIEDVAGVGSPPRHCKTCQLMRNYRRMSKGASSTKVESARRRRELMRLSQTREVSRSAVFARWGYVCWICGDLIDRDLPKGHMMRESLDHVLALAKGGRHDEDNLRPAHVLCNSLRGTKIPVSPI
jgi:hypothetical protein